MQGITTMRDKQDAGRRGQVLTDGTAGLITRVEELAYELKIKEVMTTDVKVVTPNETMSYVLDLFRQARISGAPVVSSRGLVGIISIEDLIRSLIENSLSASVGDFMTSELITTRDIDPVVEALKLFDKTGVGRLPVLDEQEDLVGILTKSDITHGLLTAIQQDFQAEEIRKYRASHLFKEIISDRTSLILRYRIKARDFRHGGAASSHIKRALIRLGADPQIARRCGIAIYEAEMNLIIHTTNGGFIRVEIDPHLILMETTDDGPGIEDTDIALAPGYTTASEEIREMGFGAGMGLPNIRRCVDDLQIESTPGDGTRLAMKVYFQDDNKAFRETDHPKQE
jgi:CBS domain-containing protein/anti-sigma regulatory factor (Ser/Thr protein kinase)